jgi:hypothetical protein
LPVVILLHLGQNECMRYLDETIKKYKKPGIIYAASQGTATTLNWLADAPYELKNLIVGLVFDSVLASGNSAIHHTVEKMISPVAASIPYSYYLLPWIAKLLLFPQYKPYGKQPITCLSSISGNIPIIIAHAKKDPQLPYRGACAIYGGLGMHGKNAYLLIEENATLHIGLYKNKKRKDKLISILKANKILDSKDNKSFDINCSIAKECQPSIKSKSNIFINAYKDYVHKEKAGLFSVSTVSS